MRIFLTLALIIFLSHTSVLAQVVVGKYHLSSTGKDYAVLVDDMQNRYKGKTVNKQLKKCQIYLQVESDTPDIEAYLKLSSGEANSFAKDLSKKLTKAQKYAKNKSTFRKKEGDSEAELYMKRHNEITDTNTFGYESGQDYEIFYERNESGQLFLSYVGESAKSEGDDGLAIRGWNLILSNEQEIQVIDELLQKAQTMIKNNSAEL